MKKLFILIIIILLGVIAFLLIHKPKPTITEETSPNESSSTLESIPVESSRIILDGEVTQELNEDEQYIKINVKYPQFTDEAINKQIKNFVLDKVASFKSENSFDNLTQQEKNMLFQNASKYQEDITYKIYQTDELGSVIFSVSTYTGGAHSNLFFKSLNFNQNEQLLSIGDLFKPESDYLSTLSDLSRKKLKDNLGENLGNWSDDGTAPTTDNFSTFYLKDDNTMNLVFDPYQVAPWSAGAPEVSLSIPNELSDIINPEFFSK